MEKNRKIKFIGLIKYLIICLLSYFIIKKNYLVFNSSDNKFTGNSKYLYKYISKNYTDYKLFFLIKDENVMNKLQIKYKNYNFVKSDTFLSYKIILKSKYLISDSHMIGFFSNNFIHSLGNFNKVQLWHGIGFKNIGNKHLSILQSKLNFLYVFIINFVNKSYNYVFASSESNKQKFVKCFNNKNVYVTGMARTDDLLKPTTNYYKTKFNLNHYSKIILYAPTYRDSFFIEPFSLDFLNELNLYLKENNQILLIKKHMNDKFLCLKQNYSNIKDVTCLVDDVNILFKDIDLLITDYSSLILDYVLLDKPLILYWYDYDSYLKHNNNFYYDLEKILPKPHIKTEKDLFNAIKITKFNKDKYKDLINLFYAYKDDNNCKRICEVLNL